MFLDCLEMIFVSLESVVKSLDVDIFTVGTVGVSFWELILGLLVLGIIFGFFLAPRYGSGIQGIGRLSGSKIPTGKGKNTVSGGNSAPKNIVSKK